MQRGNKEVIEARINEHVGKIRRVIDIFEANLRNEMEVQYDQ
jgi:hypothetical protein